MAASQAVDRARITELLQQWQGGNAEALNRLIACVHGELRRLARLHLRGEARNLSLQPTALVHEVFLRLIELKQMDWRDRAHFFAMSSRLMRRVLVDAARARRARKRGRSQVRLSVDPALVHDPRQDHAVDVLALDEALTALAARDERKTRVVELRFFGGLNVEETAIALGVSVETVARDWRFAKLWLHRALSGNATHDE